MTPGRLTELRCPSCRQVTWVIDSDYRGTDGVMIPYVERRYTCSQCRHDGIGWTLGEQSPPAFLLQPHDLYPMTQAAFDYWVTVLRTYFPMHPLLSEVGHGFRPCLPEEAETQRQAHARAYPVCEMKDQDGARCADPDFLTAKEWLEIMKDGDTLLFRRCDGGTLRCSLVAGGLSVRCHHPDGEVTADVAPVAEATAREAIRLYLLGDAVKCAERLRKPMVELSRLREQ